MLSQRKNPGFCETEVTKSHGLVTLPVALFVDLMFIASMFQDGLVASLSLALLPSYPTCEHDRVRRSPAWNKIYMQCV